MPNLGVLAEQVLDRVGVKLQGVHKVLGIAAHSQRVAPPGLASCRLQVTCPWTQQFSSWAGVTNMLPDGEQERLISP